MRRSNLYAITIYQSETRFSHDSPILRAFDLCRSLKLCSLKLHKPFPMICNQTWTNMKIEQYRMFRIDETDSVQLTVKIQLCNDFKFLTYRFLTYKVMSKKMSSWFFNWSHANTVKWNSFSVTSIEFQDLPNVNVEAHHSPMNFLWTTSNLFLITTKSSAQPVCRLLRCRLPLVFPDEVALVRAAVLDNGLRRWSFKKQTVKWQQNWTQKIKSH